ncbi:hypothetical protein F5B20DRAFT_540881 [Whalleya microplaca]|nr:hypothetical protein F5B20DRAFT_540881 [Whalleya microplaca]
MHLLTILSSALIPFAAAQDNCLGNKSNAGYCTVGDFIDRTTSASGPPTRDQCQQTCKGVLGDPSDWNVDFRGQPAGYKDTMLLYDCAFSVSRDSATDTSSFQFSMHNQDILDVMDEAIKRFADQHGGKVAAEGTMVCSGHNVRWYMD